MATSAAERLGLVLAMGAIAVAAGCIHVDTTPAEAPAPVSAPGVPAAVEGEGPPLRIGLLTGSARVQIGGSSPLLLESAGGAPLARIRPGDQVTARRAGRDLLVTFPGGAGVGPAGAMIVRPEGAGGLVRVNAREYRGRVLLQPDAQGLTVINLVAMEDYLPGVVGAEMGARPPGDQEALEAQAIVSRTYALRNRGRWAAQGFDMRAGVTDQVYAGVTMENDEARQAVAATRGLMVAWNGRPIDAFFFSACGGRTELGTEVFRGADRPYLHSVSDLAPDGRAYCSISPRFQWREEFTGASLREALRRYLPAATSVRAERVTRVRDVRVDGRTASGRVRALSLELADGFVTVPGPQIRQVLRPPDGDILRSTLFTIDVSRHAGQVSRLVVNGSGAGHAVGFCQWGAVGRARAGQRHDAIIAAYFPGTSIERAY